MSEKRIRFYSRLAGHLSWIAGALILTAWIFQWEGMLMLPPSFPTMAPNTAVSIILLGWVIITSADVALLRAFAAFCLFGVGVAGALERLRPEVPLPLNHLLYGWLIGAHGPVASPFFPALQTSACLLLLALAIAFHRARPFLSQTALAFCLLLEAASIGGQAFRLSTFYIPLAELHLTGMSVHAALCFFVATMGLILAHPRESFFARVLEQTPGGEVYRTFFFCCLFLPFLFAFAAYVSTVVAPRDDLYLYTALVFFVIATFVIGAVVAVRALDHSEQNYQELIEQAADGILVTNAAGFFTEANSAALTLLGYERSELIGRRVDDFISPEDRPSFERAKAACEKSPPHLAEWTLQNRQGRRFPVEVSSKVLADGRWQTIVRDISERRRRTEQQEFLLESARVLTEAVEYEDCLRQVAALFVPRVADFCVVFTKERGEIRVKATAHRDPSMEGFLRDTAQMFPNITTADIGKLTPQARSLFLPNLTDEDLAKGAHNEIHFARIRRIGPRSMVVLPLVARGKVIGTLSLGMVTGRRHFLAEDVPFLELAASRLAVALDNARLYAEARVAMRTREDILSVVSHDLNNPIAAVDLASQLIVMQADAEAPAEKIKELALRIRRTNYQMRRLVRSLLNFGRMQAGTFSVRPTSVTSTRLFQEITDVYRPLAEKNGVTLELHSPDDLSFDADFETISQALANLIGNALKFTPRGGQVEVSAAAEGADICLRVRDNGPGIPRDRLTRIFDRYWQPKEGPDGSAGLGLFIVRGIMEAHRGSASVESEPGKGSCFTLRFPRWTASAPKPAEDTRAAMA